MASYDQIAQDITDDSERLKKIASMRGGYTTRQATTERTWLDQLDVFQEDFTAALPGLVGDATDTALAAAAAAGPVDGFYETKSAFTAAVSGLADGIYQINKDESLGGNRTRYTVTSGVGSFQIFVERPWGSGVNFSSAVATQVGGYPKTAQLSKADGTGYWQSTADGNMTDPDSVDAENWVGSLDSGIVDASQDESEYMSRRTLMDLRRDSWLITDFMTSSQKADFRASAGLVDQSTAFENWLASGEAIGDLPRGLFVIDAPIVINDGTTGFSQNRLVGNGGVRFKGTSNLSGHSIFKLVGSALLQQYFNEFGGFRIDLNGADNALWIEALRNFDVTHHLYLTDSSSNSNSIGIVVKNSFNVCIKNYQPQTTGLVGLKVLGRAADAGFSQITNVAVRDCIMQNSACQILIDCDISPDTLLVDNTAFRTSSGPGIKVQGTTVNALALRSVHCDAGSECFIETAEGVAAYITVQDCLVSNTNNVYKINGAGELHLSGSTRHVGGSGHKLFPVCNAIVTCEGRVLADSASYDVAMQAGSAGAISNLRRRVINAAADTALTNALDNTVYYGSGGARNFYLPDISTCGQAGFCTEFQQQGGPVKIRSYAAMTLSGVSGTFAVGETITGGTSATTAIVKSFSLSVLVFYSASAAFTVGETITGGTSGAAGALSSQVGDQIDSGALGVSSIGATLTSSAGGSSARFVSKYDGTQRRWLATLAGTWAKSG